MKKNNFVKLLVGLLLFAGLLAAAILVRKQQEVRRKAALAPIVVFTPNRVEDPQAGQLVDVILSLSFDKKVSGIDLTIPYRCDYLELRQITENLSGAFDSLVYKNRGSCEEGVEFGKARVIMVQSDLANPKKAGSIAALKFKVRKAPVSGEEVVIKQSNWTINAVGAGSKEEYYPNVGGARFLLLKEGGGPTDTPTPTLAPGQPTNTLTPTLPPAPAYECPELDPQFPNAGCYSNPDNCRKNCDADGDGGYGEVGDDECLKNPPGRCWKDAYLCCRKAAFPLTPTVTSAPIPPTATPTLAGPTATPVPGAPLKPVDLKVENNNGASRVLTTGVLCTNDRTPVWTWKRASGDNVSVTETRIQRSWLTDKVKKLAGLVANWGPAAAEQLPDNDPSKSYCLYAGFINDAGYNGSAGPSCVKIDRRGPEKPVGVALEKATTEEIKVVWDRPADVGCAGLDQDNAYRYQISRGAGFGSIIAQGWRAKTQPWIRVVENINLETGDTVYVRVKAKDRFGNLGAEWSDVVTAQVTTTPGGPVRPTNTPVPPQACSCQDSPQVKGQGDANCDGKTDSLDYSIWFDTFIRGRSAYGLSADFNCDGRVTLDDYQYWLDGSNLLGNE